MTMKNLSVIVVVICFSTKIVAQNVVISNPKENCIYVGLPNQLLVAVEGHACKQYNFRTDNGKIMQGDAPCSLLIYPDSPGKANIYVNRKSNNKTIRIIGLKVKNIHDPTPILGKQNGNSISKERLLLLPGLTLQVLNMNLEMRVVVEEFTLTALRNDSVLFNMVNHGALFTQEVKNALLMLQNSDRIVLSGIKYNTAYRQGFVRPVEYIISD